MQTTYNETRQLGYLEEKGFIYQQEGIQPFYNAAPGLPLMVLPASNLRCLQKGQEENRLMPRRWTVWNPLVSPGLVPVPWGGGEGVSLSPWPHLNPYSMMAPSDTQGGATTNRKGSGTGARGQQDRKHQEIILCYNPLLYREKPRWDRRYKASMVPEHGLPAGP